MTDLPDPGTDPVPEEEPYDPALGGYGFWATLFGLPRLERRLLKRFEQLIAVSEANQASLVKSLAEFRTADTTVDSIESTAGEPK